MQTISHNWPQLTAEFHKPYFKKLNLFLNDAYEKKTIYPAREDLFNAFKLTPFDAVKVVILGQDPYHGPKQAHGLSFSTLADKLPPSLRNIFKELRDDLGIERTCGNLSDWAKQGILLLNTVLTVEEKKPHSHKNKGWEPFTDQVITSLNQKPDPIIYILWGQAAKDKIDLIDTSKHLIIQSTHPSPFSAYRGFFGSKPFSETNKHLKKLNYSPIKW